MQFQFSNDVAKLQPSAIREILKFTSMPGVISFAAGNPAPEAFPTELIADLSSKLLREHPEQGCLLQTKSPPAYS